MFTLFFLTIRNTKINGDADSRKVEAKIKKLNVMANTFEVTPKRVKRTNGTVLTPEMSITVTTIHHTFDPFYNGAKEIKEAYMRLYGFEY
jgi:formyltetrahydrofolate hydrolase